MRTENLRQSMELVGTPERCVHVADRESDIYELFCLAQDLGTRFLVVKRRAILGLTQSRCIFGHIAPMRRA